MHFWNNEKKALSARNIIAGPIMTVLRGILEGGVPPFRGLKHIHFAILDDTYYPAFADPELGTLPAFSPPRRSRSSIRALRCPISSA